MKGHKSFDTEFLTNPLVITVGVILLLIIILAIFKPTTPFLNLGLGVNAHIGNIKGSLELEAFDSKINNSPTLILFMSPNCGHCQNMKPEWEKLMQNYEGNVNIRALNCSKSEYRKIASEHGVQGYPTIRYYPNGLSDKASFIEHEGARTQSEFMSFLQENYGQ